jgi:uncharacterized protein DUF3617
MSRPAPALFLALLVPLAAAAAPRPFGTIEEFARAIGLKKGDWHTSVKLTGLDIQAPPGIDPAVAAGLRAQIESRAATGDGMDECTSVTSSAVTLPGILLENDCSFSRIEGGKGRWALSSTCKVGQGSIGNYVAQGTYSAKTVTGRHEVDLSLNGVVLHMKVATESRFIGECRPPPPPVSMEVHRPD